MAEFLVATAEDNLREAGDIIAVRPDGWQWGPAEDLRRFVALGGLPKNFANEFGIIAVPGYPNDRNLATAATTVDTSDGQRPTKRAAKSAWGFDLTGLFVADRYAELTVAEARTRMAFKGDATIQLPVALDDPGQTKTRNPASKKVLSTIEADTLIAAVDIRTR